MLCMLGGDFGQLCFLRSPTQICFQMFFPHCTHLSDLASFDGVSRQHQTSAQSMPFSSYLYLGAPAKEGRIYLRTAIADDSAILVPRNPPGCSFLVPHSDEAFAPGFQSTCGLLEPSFPFARGNRIANVRSPSQHFDSHMYGKRGPA